MEPLLQTGNIVNGSSSELPAAEYNTFEPENKSIIEEESCTSNCSSTDHDHLEDLEGETKKSVPSMKLSKAKSKILVQSR